MNLRREREKGFGFGFKKGKVGGLWVPRLDCSPSGLPAGRRGHLRAAGRSLRAAGRPLQAAGPSGGRLMKCFLFRSLSLLLPEIHKH